MDNTAVFFRVFYPKPGLVKHKIAEEAGYNMASAIYHELLRYTYHQIEKLSYNTNITIFYYPYQYKGEIMALFGEGNFDFQPMLSPEVEIESIVNSFKYHFKLGFNKVIYAAADAPDLTYSLIENASLLLEDYRCVLGPNQYNNLYLLGFNLKNYDLVLNEMLELPILNVENIKNLIRNCELSSYTLEKQNTIETLDDWENFIAKFNI